MKARASDSDVACLSAGRSRRKELVAARPSAFRGQDGRNVQTRAAAQTVFGSAVVRALLTRTEHELICQVRTGSNRSRLQPLLHSAQTGRADVVAANLLSRADCAKLVVDADVIIHCAAQMGGGATNVHRHTVVAAA